MLCCYCGIECLNIMVINVPGLCTLGLSDPSMAVTRTKRSFQVPLRSPASRYNFPDAISPQQSANVFFTPSGGQAQARSVTSRLLLILYRGRNIDKTKHKRFKHLSLNAACIVKPPPITLFHLASMVLSIQSFGAG